jgi:putative FmdB family regulatory protein
MPIYEYHCSNCNKEFEKLMGFSDPNINSPECPECQSNNTHRLLSKVASFSSRGTGFSSGSSCGGSGGFS